MALGVAAAVLLVLADAPSWLRRQTSPIASVQESSGNFYRFKASFTVKATGEKMEFDRVVPCHRIFTVYKWGETTVDMKAQPLDAPYPFLDVRVTNENKAVIVAVPNFCNSFDGPNGLVRKEIPDPLFVRATWFENADRFEAGLQYYRPVAYESPIAKIAFHGASIDQVKRADYDAWLAGTARDFKLTQNIKFPFGFSWGQVHTGSGYDHWRDDGYTWLPGVCFGLTRERISGEWRREMMRKVWPPEKPQYWVFHKKYPPAAANGFGYPLSNYFHTNDAHRNERSETYEPREFYPLVRADQMGPWFIQDKNYARQSVEDYAVRPELNGFMTCVPDGAHKSMMTMNMQMDFFTKITKRINGVELPFTRVGGGIMSLVERDEFIVGHWTSKLDGE